MKFRFYTIVWGERYLNLFLKYALPGILSKNNIPCLIGDISYFIYTDRCGISIIERSGHFKKLASLCNLTFVDIGERPHEGAGPEQSQALMNELLRKFVIECYHEKAFYKSIAPDFLISDGSFKFAYEKIMEGDTAIIVPSGALRVSAEKLKLIFGESLDNSHNNLLRIFDLTMHKETCDHIVDSSYFHPQPAMAIWRAGEGGYLVKSFAHQPWLVMPGFDGSRYNHMEFDFTSLVCRKPEEVFFVENSSQILELSITFDYEQKHLWGANKFSEKNMAGWMKSRTMGAYAMESFNKGYKIGSCAEATGEEANASAERIRHHL